MNESGCGRAMKRVVRLAIKLLVIMVFLGYIMLWFMKRTNKFYMHWLPNILANTSSTYFGEQGANTLVYVFPVLFIATLSCLYLHLGKDCVDDDGTRPMNYWRGVALVRSPLGIVSWMELSFLGMFMALLLWSFSCYLHSMFGCAAQAAEQQGVQVREAKLASSGLSFGLAGNACLAFLFFPVTRGSSVLQLVGVSSEASIKYHIWLGHIPMTLFIAHGLCYFIYWVKTHQLISQILNWDKFLASNVAGEITLLSGLLMWLASFTSVRRHFFELFYYTHHLYILFVVFYVFHVGFSTSCILLPGFYLFLIDRYLRLLQSHQNVALLSARILPCQTVELNFCKSPALSYNPRSIVFVNVPSISKLQWHPFTVSSSINTDPEKLSVIIKSEGRWSHKLYQMLSSPSSPSNDKRLEVSLEGPYGPPLTSNYYTSHDMLVMVSGGSGITPFISIIRDIPFTAETNRDKTLMLFLICAFKKSEDLTMLHLLQPVCGTSLYISPLQLQIEAYITREKEYSKTDNHRIKTIWFKPSASDAPVYAVLGPNSWLWLAAIISASFITFLLFIGIATRYYVYPIDHNTNMKYPIPARSALNLLFICVSIAMTASAAFFWNKRRNAKEMNQEVQDMDMPTPETSAVSVSGAYNADTELESLPLQSLLQSTKVHFGERPNLKKILLEFKEARSVGVLVSGPRKMRQEVATVCSSGLADNLHFESISFSW